MQQGGTERNLVQAPRSRGDLNHFRTGRSIIPFQATRNRALCAPLSMYLTQVPTWGKHIAPLEVLRYHEFFILISISTLGSANARVYYLGRLSSPGQIATLLCLYDFYRHSCRTGSRPEGRQTPSDKNSLIARRTCYAGRTRRASFNQDACSRSFLEPLDVSFHRIRAINNAGRASKFQSRPSSSRIQDILGINLFLDLPYFRTTQNRRDTRHILILGLSTVGMTF